MKKILLLTGHYYEELGGSYEAFGSTSYRLNIDKIKVKNIHFNNGETNKNISLIKVLKNHDIIHFFGAWTFNFVKTIIFAIIYKKKIIITPMGALEPWALSQKKNKKKNCSFTLSKNFIEKSRFCSLHF